MSVISLRLPESLLHRVRALSKKERVSINQFVATAVAEKISALDTEDYIRNRAKRASRKAFNQGLAQVPDVEPGTQDRLPKR